MNWPVVHTIQLIQGHLKFLAIPKEEHYKSNVNPMCYVTCFSKWKCLQYLYSFLSCSTNHSTCSWWTLKNSRIWSEFQTVTFSLKFFEDYSKNSIIKMRATHSLAIQLVLVFPVAPEAPGFLGGLAFQIILQSLAVLRAPELTHRYQVIS